MTKRVSRVLSIVAGMWVSACGGSGSGDVFCSSLAPPPMNQTGACCYRASNATRLAAPAFRLASFKVVAPTGTLSSTVMRNLAQAGLDSEDANLLIQLMQPDGSSGLVNVSMGKGARHADGTFSFQPLSCQGCALVTMTGILEGEDLMTQVYSSDLLNFSVEGDIYPDAYSPFLPLRIPASFPVVNFEILHMPMTENRSCVGRRTTRWDTMEGGLIGGFIRVADTKGGGHFATKDNMPLSVSPLTLCDLIAGDLNGSVKCDTAPQATWQTQPDSFCTSAPDMPDSVTCTTNACDPGTPDGATSPDGRPGCNAWHLVVEFAAQGVDIVE